MRIAKRISKRIANSVVAAAAAIVVAGSAGAQDWCRVTDVQPDFGYDAIDCVNCEINGHNQPWIVFHREPSIRSIRPGGPAVGRLREGDTLVALDGMAITTREAAERYAHAPRGDTVVFTVRRDGGTATVAIVPERKCVPGAQRNEALPVIVPRRSGDTTAVWRFMVTPRIVATSLKSRVVVGRTNWAVAFPARANRGWLGIGIVRWIMPDTTRLPQALDGPFGEVPAVAVVAPAGPAASAGIAPGDSLIAIDGVSLLTAAGALRFRNPAIGVPLHITVRRGGADRDVTVIPVAAPSAPPVVR